jgi:hypothetical protein
MLNQRHSSAEDGTQWVVAQAAPGQCGLLSDIDIAMHSQSGPQLLVHAMSLQLAKYCSVQPEVNLMATFDTTDMLFTWRRRASALLAVSTTPAISLRNSLNLT